jgi:hypothetical protein
MVKLSYAVNNPQVKIKKNRTDGFNLYRDLGTGDGFELVGRVTKTTYVDTIPFPPGVTSLVPKYKAVNVVDDIEVGIPSDEASITVKSGI